VRTIFKKLHLGVSTIIVIVIGLIYGFNPNKVLPLFFEFQVENLELKNIFRAMMGLYFGFALYWIVGIIKPYYWKSATLSNVIFMGGLAFGRIMSTIFDGVSTQYIVGLLLELLLAIWGIYNLRKEISIK